MKLLDLGADLLGAAIRARPPEPRRPVWIHVVDEDRGVNRWCVLREADHQPSEGREPCITTLCCWPLAYELVSVTTRRPHNTCPACETELAAWTPGAAVAIDPAQPSVVIEELDDDGPTQPRAPTADLRPAHRRVDPPAVWDGAAPADLGDQLGDHGSAFDSLNDLRIPEVP